MRLSEIKLDSATKDATSGLEWWESHFILQMVSEKLSDLLIAELEKYRLNADALPRQRMTDAIEKLKQVSENQRIERGCMFQICAEAFGGKVDTGQ